MQDTVLLIENLLSTVWIVIYLILEWVCQSVSVLVMRLLGNRVKRRLRHALMDMSSQLEHQDFVVIARKGVEDLSYQDIYSNLVHVLKIAKLYKD